MMTLAQLAALHRSLRDERVLSVYLDGTASDPAIQRSWRTQLDNALKDLREWLGGSQYDEREAFERSLTVLDDALASFMAGFGAPGWVAFIANDRVVETHLLPVSVPTLAVWSNGPAIAPYMRALKQSRPVIAVVADASKADVYRYQGGKLESVDLIRSHHVMEPVSHMGAPPRQGFHSGTRGTAGKDAAQKRMLEGRNRMINETAERAVALADADGFIVVGGIKRVVKRIVSLLGELAPGRVLELESLDIHAPLSEIADAAKQGASDLRAAIDNQRLAEIAEQAGAGGLGALGPEETRLALEQSSVRDLYLTHQFLEDHAADAERAVRAALDQQAVVEEVSSKAAEDLERLGGMAAGLRFRPISLVR